MADWCEGILGIPSLVLLDGGLEGLCAQVGCGAWARDTVNNKNMHLLYEPSLVREPFKGTHPLQKVTWNLLSPLPLLRAAAIWCFSRLSRDTPAMVGSAFSTSPPLATLPTHFLELAPKPPTWSSVNESCSSVLSHGMWAIMPLFLSHSKRMRQSA